MEKRIIMILFIYLSIFMIRDVTLADNTVAISGGKLKFTTYDTKATSGTRWKTVGFNITMKKCLGSNGNGGYPTKYEHAKIMLSDGDVLSRNLSDGRVKTVFSIPENIVTNALLKSGFGSVLKNGGTVYLNGIFQITENGNNSGGKIDNLKGIKQARAWKNSDDFDDRFDVAVTYNAANQSITVKYITENGKVIKKSKVNKKYWKKPGEKFSYKLSKTKKYNNKKYSILSSYFYYNNDKKAKLLYRSLDYGYKVSEIIDVNSVMRLGGITIVAVMKINEKDDTPQTITGNVNIDNSSDVNLKCSIAAEIPGNEKYEVTRAIPGGEAVYIDTEVTPVIYSGKLVNKMGTKNYYVTVKKKFILKWNNKREEVILSRRVKVSRNYSYWKVDNVSIYSIDTTTITNNALSGKNIVQRAKKGDLENKFVKSRSYIKNPKYQSEVVLPDETIYGNGQKPVTPTMDFVTPAENAVGNIKVRNDQLKIAGKKVMSSGWRSKKTDAPKSVGRISNVNLVTRNVLIPITTYNGQYSSTGKAEYKSDVSYGNDENQEKFDCTINGINKVKVLTPVVCDGQVSDLKKYSQVELPDTSKASLILGKSFFIRLSNTGLHLIEKGYGYDNYRRYVNENQVKFTFDVYLNNKYIKAGQWTKINSDIQSFYIPIWVKEGNHKIYFKSLAINSDASHKKMGVGYNKNTGLYGATDKIDVQISGRIANFNVYDISDYPLWKDVFRKDGELSGVNYAPGVYNMDNVKTLRNPVYTMPFMDGAHPIVHNKGTLKPGYTMRMSVDTIGEYYTKYDYIYIRPEFYFVDKKNKRTAVDIYYSETFYDRQNIKHSNSLIKVGSSEDSKNIKKMCIGDRLTGVDKEKISETARIKEIDKEKYISNSSDLFTFSKIIVDNTLQIYNGTDIMNKTQLKLPDNVTKDMVARCGQKWYFEYYLPADIHILQKDYTIDPTKIDFSDECWLDDGYLVLNFNIYVLKDRREYLDYKNQFNYLNYGHCDMWKSEGMNNKKTDYHGNQFSIYDGDVAFYYIKKSVSTDYVSGGTH